MIDRGQFQATGSCIMKRDYGHHRHAKLERDRDISREDKWVTINLQTDLHLCILYRTL